MAVPKKDPEVEAMRKLIDALDELDPEVQERAIRWAADRYGVALSGKASSGAGAGGGGGSAGDSDPAEHEELSDLFSATAPATDEDQGAGSRLLVPGAAGGAAGERRLAASEQGVEEPWPRREQHHEGVRQPHRD